MDTLTVEEFVAVHGDPRWSDVPYTICALCDHFVDLNDADPVPGIKLAAFIHLDDGEKEHDHDAVPSGSTATLVSWRERRPDLFIEYEDGIGPNSSRHITRARD